MTSETDRAAAAVKAAVASVSERQPTPDTVKLFNGVVIRCKAVSIMTLRHAQASIPKPKPPVIRNEEKQRNEEWEGDPTYIQALGEWEEKVGDVGTNVMFMLGTSIDSIPEGVDKPEDDSWLELLTASGITVNADNASSRYLSWLRLYAITTPQDLLDISAVIAGKSGVLDKDVQTSLESFPGGEDGGTDSDPETEELGGHGDPVSSANGRSHLRSGGEG